MKRGRIGAGLTTFWLLAALLAPVASPCRAQADPQPVHAAHGMVATAESRATEVGVAILKKGGNAVDAAVAVGMALAVTYPVAGNLGGGGFMLIRMANGETVAIDYREVAPRLATRNMYLDAQGNAIPDASLVGSRASGVPGTVAGLALAQQKYGKLSWREVLEPARLLAAHGFPLSYSQAYGLRTDKLLSIFPESRRIFQKDGHFYAPGDLFKQPELAATLQRLQSKGPQEFYEGETAQKIVQEMQQSHGLITLEDLKRYKPIVRTPLHGTYRGLDILTMPPPSSGGVALIEMLNTLERFPLREMGYNGSKTDHLLIETMKRAFADRAEHLGDPDSVHVPVTGLTSKRYATQLAASIDLLHATPSTEIHAATPAQLESEQTTHFSIVDAQGDAVTNTYTLNGAYGCGLTVRGAGFLLNNEMDDFAAKPGTPNGYGLVQGEANAIAPGKRPLSSMTPTIVLKKGKLYMVIGSPGGPTIITTVLQVILNVVDFDMNLREAIAAPRFHHQWLPDVVRYEAYRFPPDVRDALKGMGHQLGNTLLRGTYWGDAEGIMIDQNTGLYLGASDPRSNDSRALGY
ncbi:MAG: gamma-glutamyltransferase 1, Threonine peptidase family [Chthonomonadaceae bacterium]|nr:gamma-glutamyltransferase 1, Threonine peptidase family [Chthonomonadaceae bacterium]